MSKRIPYLLLFVTVLVMMGVLLSGSQEVAVAGTGLMTPEDFVYGQWQTAPNSSFAYTRFDGEYSYDTGLVYFLGGRLADSDTDGSVWSYDPGSGVYADSGVDMPVPISNYQIARMEDAGGAEVLMLFGGRPAAGGVINTVQGYVPSTNTTIDLTATDPYPVATAPGGVVVVDNIAFSFGGFDAVGMIDNTYFFDLQAPAGSRFTAGPPLNLARSYIAATVVDGYIYAIGGDTFDGAALYAQTIAERLDAANPTMWDDDAVADLPIACDEAPAFGFDSDSAYDYAGAIIIGGCGQWSTEIVESQLYDVAADAWDVDFPDLNMARRNHAGAFIPVGDGTAGLPGMWVWGGIQEGDANVLTVPEFNQVTPLGDFTLVPQEQFLAGYGDIPVPLGAANHSGANEVFDLSYSNTAGWDVSGPPTIGVDDGDLVAFSYTVSIPLDAECEDQTIVTVDAVGQSNTSLMDSATATVEFFCPTGIAGTIYDVNTGEVLPDAYINVVLSTDDQIYGEAFTNQNGEYLIDELVPGVYYLVVSAEGYQFSALPEGYPAGADEVTVVSSQLTIHDVELNAPIMELSDTSFEVSLEPGENIVRTLTISNTGTSELFVALGNYDESVQPPPALMPGMAPPYRVDPTILSELELNGATDFIVVMAEQADISAAYAIDDWNARGAFVFETLLETAERTQAGIRSQLTAQDLAYKSFVASNSLMVYDGDLGVVSSLATRSDVAYIMANGEVELVKPDPLPQLLAPTALTWGVQAVKADDVWDTHGVTGAGIVVANVDTGVEWTHPALEAQYRGGAGDHDYNWYMPTSGCAGELEPCDNDSHGTHTMGTMVGSTDPGDPLNAVEGIGVAPGAQWIACKGCEANGCSTEALLSCGDWILAPTDLDGMNPDPDKRPNVVNNSWGGGGGDFWYGGVVGAWRAAGIFPQFSAGNSGPSCSTTGSPGDYDQSFGAAAIAEDLSVAGFSARGPAAVTGNLQPNISAPGVNVRSSVPGDAYGSKGGTSMASPHVAGVVALVWSAQPELVGQIEDTFWLLGQTAEPLYTLDGCGGDTGTSHPNNTFGWGLVDALSAVENSAGIIIPWLELSTNGAIIPPGEEVEVALTFYAPMDEGTYEGTLHVTADEPYSPEVRIPLVLESASPAPADLSASTKEVSPETAAPGALLDYTITLMNSGELSAPTAMTDTMPAQVDFVEGSLVASAGTATYDAVDDAIYWNGEVGPTPVTITFQAEVRDSAVHGEEALNVAVIVYEDQQLELEATVLISLGDYLNWLPLMKKP